VTQRKVGQAAYAGLHREIADVVASAREATARTVNALMTATYWEIGRRIVEFEQGGEGRAAYGEAVSAVWAPICQSDSVAASDGAISHRCAPFT